MQKLNSTVNTSLKFYFNYMTLAIRSLTSGRGEGGWREIVVRILEEVLMKRISRSHRSDLLRCPRKLNRTRGAGIISALSRLDWEDLANAFG